MIYSINWLTLEQASKILNISIEELNDLISGKRVETINTRLGVRVLKHSVEDFIEKEQG